MKERKIYKVDFKVTTLTTIVTFFSISSNDFYYPSIFKTSKKGDTTTWTLVHFFSYSLFYIFLFIFFIIFLLKKWVCSNYFDYVFEEKDFKYLVFSWTLFKKKRMCKCVWFYGRFTKFCWSCKVMLLPSNTSCILVRWGMWVWLNIFFCLKRKKTNTLFYFNIFLFI